MAAKNCVTLVEATEPQHDFMNIRKNNPAIFDHTRVRIAKGYTNALLMSNHKDLVANQYWNRYTNAVAKLFENDVEN